jgi:hypothetical protein
MFPIPLANYRSDEELTRFVVYPRPRATRRDQLAFKIKSVLKGTEYEGEPFRAYVYRASFNVLFSYTTGAYRLAPTRDH